MWMLYTLSLHTKCPFFVREEWVFKRKLGHHILGSVMHYDGVLPFTFAPFGTKGLGVFIHNLWCLWHINDCLWHKHCNTASVRTVLTIQQITTFSTSSLKAWLKGLKYATALSLFKKPCAWSHQRFLLTLLRKYFYDTRILICHYFITILSKIDFLLVSYQ